jgi:hypothetical protein
MSEPPVPQNQGPQRPLMVATWVVRATFQNVVGSGRVRCQQPSDVEEAPERPRGVRSW